MATQTIQYNTGSRLSCTASLPASVIICVPASIVAAQACPEQEANQTYAYSYIEGTVTAQTRFTACGCGSLWQYTIQYDDTQIAEGQNLVPSLIQGVFYKGCFARWVEDLVGGEPYIKYGLNGGVTFVSPHGCEYVIIPDQIN